MTASFHGQVALVTGAARGQGRAHAIALAQRGCNVVAIDVDDPSDWGAGRTGLGYDDLSVIEAVERIGAKVYAAKADVRSLDDMRSVIDRAESEFGQINFVSANAGILKQGAPIWDMPSEQFRNVLDVNVTGVWNTVKAAVPGMIDRGNGGSIVITSSIHGIIGAPNRTDYVSSKHAVVGMTKSLALELGAHNIRVNAICPASIATDMVHNMQTYKAFRPDLESPGPDDVIDLFRARNVLPVAWLDAVDVSNAVLWFFSDESRYITGAVLPVDAGTTLK